MSDYVMAYRCRKIGFWERLRRKIDKKYAAEIERQQKALIREMLTTGAERSILWPKEFGQ